MKRLNRLDELTVIRNYAYLKAKLSVPSTCAQLLEQMRSCNVLDPDTCDDIHRKSQNKPRKTVDLIIKAVLHSYPDKYEKLLEALRRSQCQEVVEHLLARDENAVHTGNTY
jgi:hypothetical protein